MRIRRGLGQAPDGSGNAMPDFQKPMDVGKSGLTLEGRNALKQLKQSERTLRRSTSMTRFSAARTLELLRL
jgi:hypothetical protein